VGATWLLRRGRAQRGRPQPAPRRAARGERRSRGGGTVNRRGARTPTRRRGPGRRRARHCAQVRAEGRRPGRASRRRRAPAPARRARSRAARPRSRRRAGTGPPRRHPRRLRTRPTRAARRPALCNRRRARASPPQPAPRRRWCAAGVGAEGTCPLSTGGGTRRVQLVRQGGTGGRWESEGRHHQLRALPARNDCRLVEGRAARNGPREGELRARVGRARGVPRLDREPEGVRATERGRGNHLHQAALVHLVRGEGRVLSGRLST